MRIPKRPQFIRQLRAHSYRWQRRAIFGLGGLVVGLLAVALAIASNFAQDEFRAFASKWPYLPLIITPAGFGLAVWLARTYFPNTQGSGIPQAIAAHSSHDPHRRLELVGLRTAFGKVLLTILGLGVGASTGREGPTVQIGASVMYFMGAFSPKRQPGLIIAGAAAGVAAAFNTPLAGIVFAIEEMSRSFETRASGLIIATVILAGLTAQVLLGDYTYFGVSNAVLRIGTAWMAVPLCGVIGGLAGALFSRALVAIPDHLPSEARAWMSRNAILFAMTCGLVVALLGLMSGGLVYGTGYEQAREALHQTGSTPIYYPVLKFLATLSSSLSGVPGGIFSPSLSIGAGIGSGVAHFFHHAAPGPIILLGMVAYFTGVVRAPITGFVIVSEMSGDHSILVALMATALIAELCARYINPEGVYHLLAKRFSGELEKEKS